jgi:hypothetical protein
LIRREKLPHLIKVRKSQDAFDYLVKMYDESTIGLYEEFMVLLLNGANKVLGLNGFY